jgi:DNA-binding NarL/FixJ family response regulator
MCWYTGIVLIVDRENDVLESLRDALYSTDHILLQARSADEGLAVLDRLKFPIDLTIIDLDLPNDGGAVASLLTILGRHKNTKIIVKTSRQDTPFLESVNYFGIDAIVFKPISLEQLIRTVQKILSAGWKGAVDASERSAAA